MTDDDSFDILDASRSASLGDVGMPGYHACTVIGPDGDERLVLANLYALNDPSVRFSTNSVEHEQLGELPIDYVRRIAISRRRSQ
jgi:hypothetical protein